MTAAMDDQILLYPPVPQQAKEETKRQSELDGEDAALDAVEKELRSKPQLEEAVSGAIRDSFDTVMDGQRTMRWSLSQLAKTEKTHLGTQVEIELKKRLELPDGERLDTRIADQDVDIKFSINDDWMIPTEAIGKICILVSADDEKSTFSIGVIRTTNERLRPGENKDRKRSLSAQGKKEIHWFVRDGKLKENFLLHLDPETRTTILDQKKPGRPDARKGQKRVNTLLRTVKNRIIPRHVICVLGQQDDPMKRVRDARKNLRKEGITVLCGKYKPQRAAAEARGFKLRADEIVSFDTDLDSSDK